MADTLTVIDRARPGEAWTQAIARRMREEFSARGLSMSKVAKLAGFSQSQFSRRMTGALPFAIDEIERVCTVCRIDRDFVLTGALSTSTLLDEPDPTLLLPRLDSNQQPFGDYQGHSLADAVGL